MPKPKTIGFITCPTCDFPDMEVRRDKNGNPYAFCPDCTQQMLTHGGEKGAKLLARMRPVPPAAGEPPGEEVTDTDGEPETDPVTVTEEKPRKSTLMG